MWDIIFKGKTMLFILLLGINILLSCQENKIFYQNEDLSFSTIEQVQRKVLCRSYRDLKSNKILKREYTLTDSIITSEGVEWKAVLFSKEDDKIMLAETNWMNPDTITRVTIFDDKICRDSLISTNSTFEILKEQIDTNNLNSSPDGYLSFKDRKDEAISYVMNIDNYPNLFYGVESVDAVPDELKVHSIVLHCQK